MREGGRAARSGVFALVLAAGSSAVASGPPPTFPGTVPLAGPQPRVERAAPPQELGSALRAALGTQCVILSLPSGGSLRVWPARRVRAAGPTSADEPAPLRDRVLSSIEPGSLVGVASWDSSWIDYRNQRIPAGTYALVYAIQPEFKQHVGVSEFRDAVLLVRPTAERLGRGLAALVEASRDVSGTSHPAVAALFPVDPNAALPRLSARANGGTTLEFVAGAFRIGLAVEGKGKVGETEP